MRDLSYRQQNQKEAAPRFGRETLPACALFLLLYAFGISCGMAAYDGVSRTWTLPPLSAALAGGAWRMSLACALLYCFFAAVVQSALVLLAGLSAWLLPLWAGTVLVRSITVGACAALCLDLLCTENTAAMPLVIGAATVFFLSFAAELRLGMLPLVRRTEPCVADAWYLAVGVRLALRFLLLSLLLTAALIAVLFCIAAV